MEIYRFRCKNCGSNKCDRLNERTFKCIYCGNIEEIISESIQKSKEEKIEKPEELNQNFNKTTQEDIEIKRVPHKEENEEILTKHKTKDSSKFLSSFLKLVVCVIFGYLGVHRFIEGKIGTGIIYLFTFGLFCVGWAIDTVIYLCCFLGETIKFLGGKND